MRHLQVDWLMTTELRIKLPDKVYKRIERLAELTGHDEAEAIALTLDSMLPPLRSEMDTRPIPSLSNEEVLATADSMMDTTLNARMSALLRKRNESPLMEAEEAELEMLYDLYDVGQLRKAEAWVEAVKRGLREHPRP
jgi:hypothetical protein